MCGIAGIVAYERRYAVGGEIAERVSQRIAHRGPDGAGFASVGLGGAGPGAAMVAGAEQARTGPDGAGFASAGWQAGEVWGTFVHRRLSILDPEPRSLQPFVTTYRGRTLTLVFNGEIYNYRELRRRLEGELPDFPWRTTGDTEVLLAAYFAWGGRCVDELVGMFAFAVSDGADGSVFLARDRMGQKPLYYALVLDGGGPAGLAFASELHALTAVPWVDTSLNEAALGQYLAFGYVPTPMTIYQGAAKLPAATTLRLTPGRAPEWRTYFSVDPPMATGAGGGAGGKGIEGLVREAVASQLVADVPLGCFLSGGIDSSVIALCAARELAGRGQKLRTFSMAFDDPRYDESGYAAEVAAHLGTEHRTFRVTPDAAVDLAGLAERFGEPFADSSCLPTYYLSRETRGHVKVALSGDGGDELFAGYDRYRALLWAERVGAVPGMSLVMGGMFAGAGRALLRGGEKSFRSRVGRFLASARLGTAERYESYVRLFGPGVLGAPGLTGRVGGQAFYPAGMGGVGRGRGVGPVEAAMALDRRTYLEGDLLTKVDRASMAVGLEVRSPFMDHRLVAAAAGLKEAELFGTSRGKGKAGTGGASGGKKAVLRAAFGGELPRSVFGRRKMGFAVPIGEWFRGPLRGLVEETVLAGGGGGGGSGGGGFCGRFDRAEVRRIVEEHQSGRADHSQRIFGLVMLELWDRGRRGA